MEHLVIRLSELRAAACWQAVDEHGALLPHRGKGELEQAAAMAEGRKVVLLVPAREVFRAHMELPARGRRAAVKGARYALEDQVAGDVEDMHFSFGPGSGNRLEVAAIDRGRLGDWLGRCSAAGLSPATAYGEGDALPGPPNASVALLEQDAVLVRNGGGQFVAAAPEELPALADILCAGLADEDAAPFRLVIHCEPQLESAARQAMAGLDGREVELRLLESGVMAHMAAEALSGRGVNLLQGEFRPRGKQRHSLRDLALTLLATALLYPACLALDGWRARNEHQAAAEAVETRLAGLMPDVAEREALRAEFPRRIAAADLSAATGSDDFLRLVKALEDSGGEKARVLSLNYGNDAARVQLRAADMKTLEQTRRRMVSAGYSVLVQTATPESNGAIMAELNLRNERRR